MDSDKINWKEKRFNLEEDIYNVIEKHKKFFSKEIIKDCFKDIISGQSEFEKIYKLVHKDK